MNNENYYDVYHKNVHRGWINFNINTSSLATGGGFFELGKYIVRFEEPSYVGWGWNAEAWLTIKPLSNLVMENNYSYFELSKEKGVRNFIPATFSGIRPRCNLQKILPETGCTV